MVSTRGHPEDLQDTPTKGTTRIASKSKSKWAHTPSIIVIVWLCVSLPLVTWDTGYVMMRPLTMPGGSLHWPIWAPYELYGKVDYIYGWKAFNEHNGFTSAQGFLNILETLMYAYYLYIVYAHGKPSKTSTAGILGQQRLVEGRNGAVAVLVAYSAAVMTVSKTVLYWMNEYYSGFSNIGHNSFSDLLLLWIIPNGAWLVLPSYMIYLTATEIVQGLIIGSGEGKTE